jgi:DNA-binding MarR family transcriptional regulator
MKTGKDKPEKIRERKISDPDINLYALLYQADTVITHAIELELKHLRVSQAQARLLFKLTKENRPITIEELANWSIKGFNSVSTLINRMETKGLIKKIKKENDLKTYITLTEKGDNLYLKQITERSIHLIFGKLSEEEVNQLKKILKKLNNTTLDLLGRNYRPPFMP